MKYPDKDTVYIPSDIKTEPIIINSFEELKEFNKKMTEVVSGIYVEQLIKQCKNN